MITKTGKIKCDNCGKFIGYNSRYIWVPFGNTLDFEPPDGKDCCTKCFSKISIDDLIILGETCWIKPSKIIGLYEL